jgi:hypothetical protein
MATQFKAEPDNHKIKDKRTILSKIKGGKLS